MYFAENRDVGVVYKEGLAPDVHRIGKVDSAYTAAAKDLMENGYSFEQAREAIKKAFPEGSAQDLEVALHTEYGNMANLYNVDLNVTSDELLDWDAPLSGQSEAVKAKLKPIVDDIAATETPDDFNLDYVSGEELYQRLVTKTRAEQDKYYSQTQRQALGRPPLPSPEELVSKRLNEAGVSGIRFLDAGSREVGEGTRNYVIFDDALIDIKQRMNRGGIIERKEDNRTYI